MLADCLSRPVRGSLVLNANAGLPAGLPTYPPTHTSLDAEDEDFAVELAGLLGSDLGDGSEKEARDGAARKRRVRGWLGGKGCDAQARSPAFSISTFGLEG